MRCIYLLEPREKRQERFKEMNIGYGEHKGIDRLLISVLLIGRILLALLRALLGVLLLSDVSFKATYREQQEFPLLQAGLTSMNTSLVNDPDFPFFATGNFWWHFPSMMSYSHPITSVSCSGSLCQSFYFPGPISLIQFPPGAPAITHTDSPLATTFIEKNSPGYQIEFYPVDESKDPPILMDDCRVFGIPIVALQVCLKKTNDSSFLAGTARTVLQKVNESMDPLSPRRCSTNELSKHQRLAPDSGR